MDSRRKIDPGAVAFHSLIRTRRPSGPEHLDSYIPNPGPTGTPFVGEEVGRSCHSVESEAKTRSQSHLESSLPLKKSPE